MNRLAIIVLNWNGSDDAIECVDSLIKQTLKPTIVIVDNNSSDNSVTVFEEYISSHKKEKIILLKNSDNLGFAGGINTGLIYALKNNFEYIGVLNPDAIADRNWCEALIYQLSKYPECGIATGILQRRNSKTLDTTGDFYTTWGLPGPRNRDEPIKNAPTKPGEVFGATGGGAIYRAKIFDDIDMFDEDFFMYGEDIDLSYRLLKGGFENWFFPTQILHYKGESTQRSSFRYVHVFYAAMLIFFRKHYNGMSFLLSIPIKIAIYLKATSSLFQMLCNKSRKLLGFIPHPHTIGPNLSLIHI